MPSKRGYSVGRNCQRQHFKHGRKARG
jgi:hypothetical protein